MSEPENKKLNTAPSVHMEIRIVDNGIPHQLKETQKSVEEVLTDGISMRIIPLNELCEVINGGDIPDGQYVMYLYSGSLLVKKAFSDVCEKISKEPSAWFFFNEKRKETVNGAPIIRTIPRSNRSLFSFLLVPYCGECLIFSSDVANKIHINYSGDNYSAMMTLMALSAAKFALGTHINRAIVELYKRPSFSPEDNESCKHAADQLISLNDITFNIEPEENCYCAFRFVPTDIGQPTAKVFKYNFVLNEAVINEALNSTADICCFASAKVTVDDASLNRIANYAYHPEAGIVSPQLINRGRSYYCGAFSVAGIPKSYDINNISDKRMLNAINSVHDTLCPSADFFAIKHSLLKELLSDPAYAAGFDTRSVLQSFAIRLNNEGLVNLYVGDIALSCAKIKPIKKVPNFIPMLSIYEKQYMEDLLCPQALKSDSSGLMYDSFYPEVKSSLKDRRGNILVISHELSLTGAPIVLMQAVSVLKDEGWNITIMSPADGDIKESFAGLDIPVIIYPDMTHEPEWLAFASSYDLIIVNTIVPYKQIEQLKALDVPVLWWLHDARSGYADSLQYVLPEKVGKNIHIYSVSEYAYKAAHDFRPKYQSGILPYGINDIADDYTDASNPFAKSSKTYNFVCTGTLINRKGQDILIKAIELLPDDVREKCYFVFIGKNADKTIAGAITDAIGKYPDCVSYIEAVPHDEIMSYYKYATAVICPSRDDPLPTVMAETMMLSGRCICSENTGTAAVIENGVNGFTYPDDDPAKLADCIVSLIRDTNINEMKCASRKTFEDNFSMPAFDRNINNCIESCMNRK